MAFCTTCGRPVADGVINCGICDPQQKQQVIVAPPPPRKTSLAAWLALPIVGIFMIAAIVAIVQQAKEAQAPPPEKPCLPAESILYGWQHGMTLPTLWAGGFEAERLYAVTDFDLIGKTVGAARAVCSIRVHSSTRGGLPIVADWNFTTIRRKDAAKVKAKDRWLVVSFARAQ